MCVSSDTDELLSDCDYISAMEIDVEHMKKYNFNILHLNVRSLNKHINDLNDLLLRLKEKNCRIDVITLSETHLNHITKKLINIPGFSLVSK